MVVQIVVKAFLGYISGKSLAHLGHILGIFGAYLGHILDISLAYLGHILGIFWAYFGYILDISWAYLRHILGIFWLSSWAYLGHILVVATIGCQDWLSRLLSRLKLFHCLAHLVWQFLAFFRCLSKWNGEEALLIFGPKINIS